MKPTLAPFPFTLELSPVKFDTNVKRTDQKGIVLMPGASSLSDICEFAGCATPLEEYITSPIAERFGKESGGHSDPDAWVFSPSAEDLALRSLADPEGEWRTVRQLCTVADTRGWPTHIRDIVEVMADAGSAHAKLASIGLALRSDLVEDDKHESICRSLIKDSCSAFVSAMAEMLIGEIRLRQGGTENGEWYERYTSAAMRGHPIALFGLGVHFHHGKSDVLDETASREVAKAFYSSGIRRGCLNSLTNFALLHTADADSSRLTLAKILLNHAHRLGDELAGNLLTKFGGQMEHIWSGHWPVRYLH